MPAITKQIPTKQHVKIQGPKKWTTAWWVDK